LKARPRRALGAAIGGVAICVFIASASRGDEQEQLDALRGRIERLRAGISDVEGTRSEAQDQLRDSERAISSANRELRELTAKRESARADLQKLASQARAAEAEIATRREMLGQLLAQRYLHGEQSGVRLVLSGNGPNQAARELHYYSYISEAQARFIGTLRETLARIREIESRIREKSAELAVVASAQKTRREELLKQKAERRKVLARVSGRLSEQRREIRSLQRDETRLSRLLEELAKVLADSTSSVLRNDRLPEAGAAERQFLALKGKLRLPVRGEIANRFGTPRPGGGPSWKGLFIRSPAGEEVRAVASGRVVFAEWLRGFGNLLILDHGDAYLTIYGNNESLLRQVGDVVRTGDVVATIGNSGGSEKSGIYFELRHEGKPFDPLRWVSLR
jgi:septal ring factor EnvC (AmiA/AmiB activator)